MGEINTSHKTDIVIVGWNHTFDTQRAICSIVENTDGRSYRIIYIDNGSKIVDAEALLYQNENITFVRLPTNTGYCHGNNIGLAMSLLSDSEYVLLLNNDCEIPDGDTFWLQRMIDILQFNAEVGAVGAVSDTVFGYQKRGKPPQVEATLHASFGISALIGFCQLIRKTALEQVGLLDERFDPDGNYSDFDYSIRLARAGWKMAIAESVWINHVGSVTQKDLDFNANLQRNQVKLREKWGNEILRGVGL